MTIRSEVKEMSCQLEAKAKRCDVKEKRCQPEVKSKRCDVN